MLKGAGALRVAVIVVVAAISVLLGVLASRESALRDRQLVSGILLAKPRAIADFALVGEDGKPYTRADLLGHWTVVFTGYTYCPDVCPTTLSQLKSAKAKLGADAARLTVLFVSVDPERDTPDRLANYVRYFDPQFRAATGTIEQLEALGTQLSFVFLKNAGPAAGSYTIDHSAELILLNPKARLAGYLTPPFYAETLSADLKTVLGGTTFP